MNLKIREFAGEFLRYALVGGISFIVDFGVLFILNEYILTSFGEIGLYLATAMGFVAGLIVNYFLSLSFVFLSAKAQKKGKDLKSILIFVAVGIVGLILTELGMFLGTNYFHFNYLVVKIGLTIVVLLWNYLGRKILIFR